MGNQAKGASEDADRANPVVLPGGDQLGFSRYWVPTLIEVIEGESPPHVVGVYAPPGGGKTSLLRLLQQALEGRGHKTIWLQPRQCSLKENAGRALLCSIYTHLRTQVKIKTVAQELNETGTLSPSSLEHLSNAEDPKSELEKLLYSDPTGRYALAESLGSLLSQLVDEGKRLVVLMDDLDHCHLPAIREITKAIKEHLSLPRCLFVISISVDGSNQEIHGKAADRHPTTVGDSGSPASLGEAIQEAVQLEFRIPEPEREKLEEFIAASAQRVGLNEDYQSWRTHLTDIVIAVAGKAPAKVKKLVSSIHLWCRMAELKGRGLQGEQRMKLVKVCAMIFGLSDRERDALFKCPDLAWPPPLDQQGAEGAESEALATPEVGHHVNRSQWGNRIGNRLFVRQLWRLQPRIESIAEFQELLGLLSGSVGLRATLADERELCDLLRKEDQRIPEAVAKEISRFGEAGDDYVCFCMCLLDNQQEDAIARANAASVLGKLKKPIPAVVEALLSALQDGCQRVRVSAAYALADLGRYPKETIESLIPALYDENPDTHAKAVAALRQPRETSGEVKTVLIYTAQSKEPDTHSDADQPPQGSDVKDGKLEEKGLEPSLSELVSARLSGLGEEAQGPPEAAEVEPEEDDLEGVTSEPIKTLIGALRNSDSDVRMNAATDLGEFGEASPAIMNALVKALNDRNGGVRWRAAMAIRKLGHSSPEEAMECLQNKLGKEKDIEVRERIQSVINDLTEN